MTEDTRSSDGFTIRDARELGLAVRALRRSRGWTQADLSRVAGISRPALIRLERGESVRVSTLMDALTFLGARIRVERR
ncbi:MAG: helix-turn-helix domain-containing protein [Chloroflexota bacterium]